MTVNDAPEPSTLRTNTELLHGLRDAKNDAIWRMFVDRYQPVLVTFAKRLGLSHAAAEDAAQDALVTFMESFVAGKYAPEKGRLRSWLFGHATNAVRRQWRKAGRERVVPQNDQSTAMLDKVPDDHSMSEVWEDEWRQAVLGNCLDELRKISEPRTMQAFELYVLKEWPADKVAEAVGISRDAVFQAKRRLMVKMRNMLETLDRDW